MEDELRAELRRRNQRLKVVSVAAGEAHTLALAGDGKVYSWGRGTFGRLGTGSESDENFPVPVKFDNDDDSKAINIVGVAAGAYHSLALDGNQLLFPRPPSSQSLGSIDNVILQLKLEFCASGLVGAMVIVVNVKASLGLIECLCFG